MASCAASPNLRKPVKVRDTPHARDLAFGHAPARHVVVFLALFVDAVAADVMPTETSAHWGESFALRSIHQRRFHVMGVIYVPGMLRHSFS